ncbi:MAG: D-2-hydroxyacid dehydrogenase [Oscillibacter sp.]|nr:D-2-hydroxyacid dehydrogenase [Oscillibacter sp.]
MKIVILDGYCLNPGDLSWDGFAAMGEVTVYDRTPTDDEDGIVRRIGDGEIVLTNKTPITRAILDRCPSVRYIGILATGYNVVDTAAARGRGVPVCNVPGYGTASVAQLTIALLLEICHKAGQHNQAVHQGRWSGCADYCFWDGTLIELAGKTMGIVGYGSIGRAVGEIARALGMTEIATGPHPWADGERPAPYVPLEELLERSDVVSLHCPLFPETRGLINRERIARMKDGAILLNTSRGPLIVERDVADALNSGKLRAAGVDVAETEPIPADSPLLTAKNCVITPHIAWAPLEARQRLMDIAVGNLRAFLNGSPENVVN